MQKQTSIVFAMVLSVLASGLGLGQALFVPDADGTVAGIGISTNGNVGIGTTSPGAKLDIAGGNVFLSTPNTYYRAHNGDSNILKFATWHSSSTNQFGFGQLFNELWLGALNGNGGRRIGFYLYAPNSGYAGNNNTTYPTNYEMSLDLSGLSIKNILKVNGTNDSYFLGDVGIGTTSPQAKLDVDDGKVWIHQSGGANHIDLSLGELVNNSNTALYDIITDDATGDILDIHCNRWGADVRFSRQSPGDGYQMLGRISGGEGDHNFALYNPLTTEIKVKIASNASSYFNGGNVGIGTTNPSEKLSLNDPNEDSWNIKMLSFGLYLGQTNGTSGSVIGHNIKAAGRSADYDVATSHSGFGYRAITFGYTSETDGIKFYT